MQRGLNKDWLTQKSKDFKKQYVEKAIQVITRPKKGVERHKEKTTWDKLHASTLISTTTSYRKEKQVLRSNHENAIKGI